MEELRRIVVVMICVLVPVMAQAQDRLVRLYAPPLLVDSGVLKFALPRFSLKTQVRVEILDGPEGADIVLGPDGRALFSGLGQTWGMQVQNQDHPGTGRLVEWLTSDVGARTIAGFAPDGTALFGPPEVQAQEVVAVTMDGDAILGHEVSRSKCTRCHKVDDSAAMVGIGSTPSFAVLRSLPDWESRFSAFYVLNPHPSFTQIEDVTDPFPINRPSPIAPLEMTLEEVEAVLAYVAAMPAADLGAPLIHQ